jgi:hypothetical protein
MTEFAVRAETHAGNLVVVRRGFKNQEDAEDHPIRAKDYRRIWVEPIEPAPKRLDDTIAKPVALVDRKTNTLRAFTKAAVAGKRAPMNGTFGVESSAARRLAFDGVIRIEVYAKNWRVITLLEGEHAGKHTMLPPHGGRAYVTIDKNSSAPRYWVAPSP